MNHPSTVLSARESVTLILQKAQRGEPKQKAPVRNHALCRTGRAGIHPGQWYQLTELVVVTLKEGLAALLLFTGLLAAARGVAATVLLSSGWEVCLVLESKKRKMCFSPWGNLDASLFTVTKLLPSDKGRGCHHRNLCRSYVAAGRKSLPKGSHLFLVHFQFFLNKAADLVKGRSLCGLQAPARLHDGVPAQPKRNRTVAMLLKSLHPQAIHCSIAG